IIQSLDVSQETRIQLSFAPPQNISAGRYEVRIRTTSLSDDQPISGEDKTVTIEIQPETNLLGMAFIVFVIVGLVVGIVVYGIRLSRR
nr:hypothetical protein [candidate division KSB1 bacterium]NIR71375.1 hypothetical protein [candidate division KSB1 bacterium]NIS22862.1 hypothetical protein [candidate division KSB1 bacterium]NIT69700.1 hypothetical protein [candidate division KSB1 bacterium]NIU23368.1 hypothetical protein [candidate division KSB1 bacterium]